MIASGILFKAGFDMSSYSDEDILRQYNPYSKNAWSEDILTTTEGGTVTKEVILGDTVKIIAYKGKESLIEQVLFSSKCMEMAAPKLVRVVQINPGFYLLAFPYYRLSTDDLDEDVYLTDEDITDEDEELFELNETIESTVKELGRISMFFMQIGDSDKEIIDNIKLYVEKCFKFQNPEEDDYVITDISDYISEDLEDSFKELLDDFYKNRNNNEDDSENDD